MKKLSKITSQYLRLALVAVFIIGAGLLNFLQLTIFANWLIIIFSSVVTLELLIVMIKDLRNKQYGVDLLAILAIISTMVLGEYWATIVIVAMLTGGESLERYASERAKTELKALLSRVPKVAHVIRDDGSVEEVAVSSVKIGMLLRIRIGDVLPVDGVVVEGTGFLDESSITGESLPIEVGKNDAVLSGSLNGDSILTIKASKTAANSQYSQIVKLVQSAAESNSPFVRLADRYAVPFTGVSLLIAGLAWALSGEAVRFAEVLVVATPCPLLIAAPVAIISGMSRSAKHGIIVKSGAVLEKLSQLKTIIFDKTGTLTENRLEVHEILPEIGTNSDDLMSYAASLEQNSPHILAKAISIYASEHKVKLSKVLRITEEAGNGIRGHIGQDKIEIGSLRYLTKLKIKMPLNEIQSKTAVYLAKNGEYIGVITFSDALRENSHKTIIKLKSMGIKEIAMLTGDNQKTASRIATLVGIDKVVAECLPTDKLQALNTFKKGPVAMVGDGVNDAPVLAASDVGIAMGSRGETAASESADVVIMLDDIYKVYESINIAKRTMKIAVQSVYIGIGLSIILEIMAAFGYIPPLLGAGLQEIIDVVVIFNALRAHSDKLI
jgi:heavy metal translocating P-type ATPase